MKLGILIVLILAVFIALSYLIEHKTKKTSTLEVDNSHRQEETNKDFRAEIMAETERARSTATEIAADSCHLEGEIQHAGPIKKAREPGFEESIFIKMKSIEHSKQAMHFGYSAKLN